MIDLHVHTNYSDGSDSLIKVLEKAQKYNLSIISITDHDNMDAYFELQNLDIEKIYTGKIIPGIEITTSINDNRIELLAYDFKNIKKIDDYFKNFHTDEHWNKVLRNNRLKLLNIFDKLNLKYDTELIKYIETDSRLESKIYNSILKNNDNLKEILGSEYYESGSEFFRKSISNPKSKFYLNYAKYNPSIENIINLIHENSGKVFLAHPYIYNFDNLEQVLNKLIKFGINGIECFHNTHDDKDTKWLIEYCTKNNLLMSGGSDYHGDRTPEVDMKVGTGNLNIPKDIVSNWLK